MEDARRLLAGMLKSDKDSDNKAKNNPRRIFNSTKSSSIANNYANKFTKERKFIQIKDKENTAESESAEKKIAESRFKSLKELEAYSKNLNSGKISE
ncbi:MAG: hypothetical protein MHPSP_000264, partial [Paramarteilia canceri]